MIQILTSLFIEFIKIGLFCWGGGLAVLALLQERSISLSWLTEAQFGDMIAIAQSTPGPIAINLATFVGFLQGGFLGSLVATVSLIIPGFIISIIVGKFLKHFNEYPIVQAILKGLRAIVIGLIVTALYSISKVSILNIEAYQQTQQLLHMIDYKAILLFALFLFLVIKFKKHPIYYILAGAVFGMVIWA